MPWRPCALTLCTLLLVACGEDSDVTTSGLDTYRADTAGVADVTATDTASRDTQTVRDTTPPAPVPTATELLFAEDAPVWHFDIDVAAADLQWLDQNVGLEAYVPASVLFKGGRYAASIRYKGGFGSLHSCIGPTGELVCDKLSYKISFNEVDPRGRFHGLRKLVLHGCNRDATCLRERLAYGLFRDAGIATSRVVHATASINGAPPSLFALVEYIDKEFLEDHFSDASGNLYKEAWPGPLAASFYAERLRTNASTADVSRLLAFAQVLADTSDATFNADVAGWIDTDRMAVYDAVDQLTHNWDGIWKFYCVDGFCANHNHYLYDDPASGRFVVIPWDLDHTWSSPNTDMARGWLSDTGGCAIEPISVPGIDAELGIRAPQCDPLMRGLMLQSWDAYRGALGTLLSSPATRRDALLQRLTRYRALLRPHVAADPRAPEVERWDAAVTQLRQIIIAQYDEAERFLVSP